MPKHNARRVLANTEATREEIEDAIAQLKRDIDYLYRHHHPQLRESIEESHSLLDRLQDKLNSQSK